jgi:hypothetical protein
LRTQCLLLLALLASPAHLGAQTNPKLLDGTRIRVTPIGGQSLKGTFKGSGPQGLSYSDETGSLHLLSNESIQRLDMSGGKNRRKAALIGGAVGLVAGVLIGAATSGDCTGDCDDPYGVGGDGLAESVATGTGVMIGGAVFGGLGALVGGLFFAPERWVRVEFGSGIPVGR